MYTARNNPNPIPLTVVCSKKDLEEQQQKINEDYKFYAKALRVLYNKSKLRKNILDIMHGLENIRYMIIPECK